MELRQLRHFRAVAELGGFGIAAEHLSMSQPALSKSIRALETSLAVTLMDRGPGGLKLTSYGERLLDYARSVLQLTEEARDELDAMRGARRGKLNIGAITTAQRTILPNAIRAFLRSHPEVEVRVNEELNNGLVEMLQSGQIDIAILSRPIQPLPETLAIRVIAATPIVLAVDPQHPLAGRETVSLADLGPFEWIVPPRPEPDRLQLEYLFASETLPGPRVRVETTSAVFQTSLLAGTEQISYMTRSSRFRQDVEGRGQSYGYRLLSDQSAPLPLPFRTALNHPGNEDWRAVHALHLADGAPFCLEARWINPALVAAEVAFDTVSANEWLVRNLAYSGGDFSLYATPADEELSGLLQCAQGAALFAIDRTTFLEQHPITAVTLTYAPGYRMMSQI